MVAGPLFGGVENVENVEGVGIGGNENHRFDLLAATIVQIDLKMAMAVHCFRVATNKAAPPCTLLALWGDLQGCGCNHSACLLETSHAIFQACCIILHTLYKFFHSSHLLLRMFASLAASCCR